MIFQRSKTVALKILSPLMLLTACAQPPNYAPVKTVNQALEPTNGYYLRKKPNIRPEIEASNNQQSGDIMDKKQGLSPGRQNSANNESSYPEPYRSKPAKIREVKQSATKATANDSIISDKGTYNRKEWVQDSTKNKLDKPAANKIQDSKSHNLATLGQQSISQPKNKSILSNTNASNTQENQSSYEKSLDNVQLTGKNNKKSIISIDNKKMLKLNFQWPLLGKISRNFSQTDNKGILIRGKTGQAVHAAEAGKAVYCGQGLPGFGNLAIIKHNATYLSAYANNSKLTIKEGQQVAKGQMIGQVGLTGLKKSSLHFEIRKNGKPINPMTMLPKQ